MTRILLNHIKRHHQTILFLGLGLITGFLSTHYSKDWKDYLYWYGLAKDTTWSNLVNDFSPLREPIYNWVAKAIGGLIGFASFVLIATVLLLFVKLRYLAKILDSAFIGTFFYVCLYLLLLEGTVIRAGYAVALIVPALYFLKIQRPLYSFILVILASQIHFTASLFLIIFPLYYFRQLNIVIFIIFLLSPLLIVFDVSAFAMLRQGISAINPRYLLYGSSKTLNQNSTGLYFYFIAFYGMLLIAIYCYLKEKIKSDRFAATIFSICLSGIILMCVFHDHVAVGARLGELLLLPVVILLSWLYMYFSARLMYLHQIALTSIFMLYFVARLLYLYPALFT